MASALGAASAHASDWPAQREVKEDEEEARVAPMPSPKEEKEESLEHQTSETLQVSSASTAGDDSRGEGGEAGNEKGFTKDGDVGTSSGVSPPFPSGTVEDDVPAKSSGRGDDGEGEDRDDDGDGLYDDLDDDELIADAGGDADGDGGAVAADADHPPKEKAVEWSDALDDVKRESGAWDALRERLLSSDDAGGTSEVSGPEAAADGPTSSSSAGKRRKAPKDVFKSAGKNGSNVSNLWARIGHALDRVAAARLSLAALAVLAPVPASGVGTDAGTPPLDEKKERKKLWGLIVGINKVYARMATIMADVSKTEGRKGVTWRLFESITSLITKAYDTVLQGRSAGRDKRLAVKIKDCWRDVKRAKADCDKRCDRQWKKLANSNDGGHSSGKLERLHSNTAASATTSDRKRKADNDGADVTAERDAGRSMDSTGGRRRRWDEERPDRQEPKRPRTSNDQGEGGGAVVSAARGPPPSSSPAVHARETSRRRGVSNLPAWMTKGATAAGSAATATATAAARPQSAAAAATPRDQGRGDSSDPPAAGPAAVETSRRRGISNLPAWMTKQQQGQPPQRQEGGHRPQQPQAQAAVGRNEASAPSSSGSQQQRRQGRWQPPASQKGGRPTPPAARGHGDSSGRGREPGFEQGGGGGVAGGRGGGGGAAAVGETSRRRGISNLPAWMTKQQRQHDDPAPKEEERPPRDGRADLRQGRQRPARTPPQRSGSDGFDARPADGDGRRRSGGRDDDGKDEWGRDQRNRQQRQQQQPAPSSRTSQDAASASATAAQEPPAPPGYTAPSTGEGNDAASLVTRYNDYYRIWTAQASEQKAKAEKASPSERAEAENLARWAGYYADQSARLAHYYYAYSASAGNGGGR